MARPSGVGGRISPDGYITINPDQLAKYARDGGGPIIADLTRRATNVQAGARRQVGKRTWRLHDSIVKRPFVDSRGPGVEIVTEGVSYALMHHNGTDRWHGNRFLTDNLHLAAR
jgi:hypothetical protein